MAVTPLFLPRNLLLQNNNLTGVPPPSLTKFGTGSFDYNCFDGYSYLPWQWCAPLNATLLNALSALYAATNGTAWTARANWLVTNPCYVSWTGVACAPYSRAIGWSIRLASMQSSTLG